MIYTLTFTCNGKSYSNSQSDAGKCLPNQYEAVANGLLLGKIEEENLSREDKYVDVSLTESDGKVEEIVWTSPEYFPISTEVK